MSVTFRTLISWFFTFCLALELYARIDDYFRYNAPFFSSYTRDQLVLVDDHGLRNRPYSSYQKWRINNYGFRDRDDTTIEKSPSMVRVMALGASETFGLYESPEGEYPARLEDILNRGGRLRYEVMNGAVPGISPPRLAYLYRSYYQRFAADLVVYYPSLSSYLMRDPPSASFVRPAKESRERFSIRLLDKVRISIKKIFPETTQLYLRRLAIALELKKHPPQWVFNNPPPDRADLLYHQLNDFIDALNLPSERIILCTHAMRVKGDGSKDDEMSLAAWRKLYPHVSESSFIEMETVGNRIIRQVCQERNLRLVDLDTIVPKSPEYFVDHVHFNDRGAKLVAESIAATVLSLQPVNPN